MATMTAAPTTPTNAPGNGAAGTSLTYYDEAGRRRTAAAPVPVDQFGAITSVQFVCRKCPGEPRWVPKAMAKQGVPVCTVHGIRMQPQAVRNASAVPWAAIRSAVATPLRPVYVLAGLGAAGIAAGNAHVPPLAVLAATVPAAIIARAAMRKRQQAKASRVGPVDDGMARQVVRIIGSKTRHAGYCVAVGGAWLTLADFTGLAATTVGGRVSWTVLVAAWSPAAATWWRTQRRRRAQRRPADATPVEADEVTVADVPMDPDEAQTREVWAMIPAGERGKPVTRHNGTVFVPERTGKLAGTWLEDWRKVAGGWAAVIVGPDGMYTEEAFRGAQRAIASAFRAKTSMVTIIPDDEDENRATVMVQRTSPIRGVVTWPGPADIIDGQVVAPIAQYADGGVAYYEIVRPGWGTPHALAIGTTGSGKSEFLNQWLAIDRWAAYVDETGQRRGRVASFLIDPAQGQSFAPFLDDLAGPVASSLAEATILVEALTQEMQRRNRYLARQAKTWDPKRQIWRTGRKWWDPTIDGPILTLTIDEAHEYLANRDFAQLVTAAARLWRKCGGQIRLATQTPLLSDLGGSMALRDMLSGGFVAVFRTANSLSGPVAFNGRLPVDPRTIPTDPGSCYILTGQQPRPMLARAMWVPDYYDYVRDEHDQPIGYPAPLPAETLATFGPEYAAWVAHTEQGNGTAFIPGQRQAAPAAPEPPAKCVDMVISALVAADTAEAGATLNMEDLIAAITTAGGKFSVRTVRDALKVLRDGGDVRTENNRHSLTDMGRERLSASTLDRVSDSV